MTDRRQQVGENQTPVRAQDKVMLRLPDGMRDRLKDAAAENNRSMNAEIVSLIEYAEMAKAGVGDIIEQRNKLITENAELVRALQSSNAARLPESLMKRIERRASETSREPHEEILQALEAAFPLFSLDQFNEEWIARILVADETERPALVEQANAVLKENGDDYEVWLGNVSNGDEKGSVVLARRLTLRPGEPRPGQSGRPVILDPNNKLGLPPGNSKK